ncbi:MAG: hypothetical protein K6A23_10765 [Butyrivibrio sp.]|nr:hypothetical protein [Butyrivibrio sp.]
MKTIKGISITKYQISYERSFIPGVRNDGEDLCICAAFHSTAIQCGIVLFTKTVKHLVLFSDEYRTGNLYSLRLKDAAGDYDSYMLYEDGNLLCDPRATRIYGLEKFGAFVREEDLRCGITAKECRIPEPCNLNISYENSLVYLLHVRGYTKSPASGVESSLRGTFKGLTEKIDYIKSLGVTAVELMPIYEMISFDKTPTNGTPKDIEQNKNILYIENGSLRNEKHNSGKLNFWGYKKGWYFAPRSAYSSDKNDPESEVKDMIDAFHKNNIEVILQFYFPTEVSDYLICDCLRYWVSEYHIDGVHLKGQGLPVDAIISDPVLADIKIWYDWFDYGRIGTYAKSRFLNRRLAEYSDNFMFASRRFLKGDDCTLNDFIGSLISNSNEHGTINYVANYEGLRLSDLVSYEHKRNEDNGENNKDGTDNNLSWNCGIEGNTKKTNILRLRKRQMKNILTMLLLSQGTPMIFGGDEFGNSQNGNNNPYCQDNHIGWVDWNMASRNTELTEYVKAIVKLRKDHNMLHCDHPFKLMDYKACGYPDLSYHGQEAWRPDLSNYSHSVGLLYCGLYNPDETDNSFVYVIYNMHWTPIKFALPELPQGLSWQILATTGDARTVTSKSDKKHLEILCEERSCVILISKGTIVKKAVDENVENAKQPF